MAATAAPVREQRLQVIGSKSRRPSLRAVMPSVADLFFFCLFLVLTLGQWATRLLWDTSTGWHIRTGERILQTLSIPRTDSFSYTMSGQPWFAWEWLWDAANGALHLRFGLSGPVVLTAFVIALTFALLYRTIAARSENVLVSATLVLLAFAASSIHFLARPHVVSWLFAVVTIRELRLLDRGNHRATWTLPLLFCAWANLHGGWVFGLVLIAVWLVAALLDRNVLLTRRLAISLPLCAAATVLNPYGLKLHLHVLRYLGSRTQMDNIDEFLSPNFHYAQPRVFLLLALIAVALMIGSARRVPWRDLLLTTFAIAVGLLATRNIPLAAILLAYTTAPFAAEFLRRSPLQRIAERGDRFHAIDITLRGHLVPVLAVVVLATWLAAGHRLGNATWDNKRVPATAANFLINNVGAHDHVFSPDFWGGYLIHMYGNRGFRVAVDDRSDFYGDDRFRQYAEVANAGPEWEQILDSWQVRYALVPANSSLRALLAGSSEWRQAYGDDVAAVFVRAETGAAR